MKTLSVITVQLTPIFAQITSVSQFREKMGSVLGIIMIIAFMVGVGMIISGALKRDGDPAAAKNAMVTGAIIAGAVAIMSILYFVFDQGSGAVTTIYK